MTKTHRSQYTAAILAHIEGRFRESDFDDAIWINCPITDRESYEIHPEGGLKDAGFYIAINGEADEKDPRLNYIPTLDEAKAEVAERIASTVEAAQKVLDGFHHISEPAADAA